LLKETTGASESVLRAGMCEIMENNSIDQLLNVHFTRGCPLKVWRSVLLYRYFSSAQSTTRNKWTHAIFSPFSLFRVLDWSTFIIPVHEKQWDRYS